MAKISSLSLQSDKDELSLIFHGTLSLYQLNSFERQIKSVQLEQYKTITIDLQQVEYLDTAMALYLNGLSQRYHAVIICENSTLNKTLQLVQQREVVALQQKRKKSFLEALGKKAYKFYEGLLGYIHFLGVVFISKLYMLGSLRDIRIKEIAFEINESAIKALGIIALTSFLIGLVVAYQSAYQLKIYGANIYIVDMLGLSILRELSPLITAIVIAGRSGSAYSAQIGAMKITQELDAMKTMGFDPYAFLVFPRTMALMLMMPILIFISDIMAMLGGMLVANIDLKVTTELFIDRFNEVIALKHFLVGVIKGPFFAFLIASIGIYRGLQVKDDTQSIGFNTTKSVVESIFAVIVCDAIFSIMFTNLGI